jgi:hypothetical protein
MWPLGWMSFIRVHVVITCICKVVFHSSFFLHFFARSLTFFASKWTALQVSKVAWSEVCLVVSQTTHDLYGLMCIIYVVCGSSGLQFSGCSIRLEPQYRWDTLAFIQCIPRWYSLQYYDESLTWISTNINNIYLASIRFGTLQYLCNTLYKSHRIPVVLGFLPYCQFQWLGQTWYRGEGAFGQRST